VEALAKEGATVDLICIASQNAPTREHLEGINILRLPFKHPRSGKFQYGFRYSTFILISTVIFAVRSIGRRYAVVYVNNMPDILIVCALIPKLFGSKAVLDLHDPMPELMMTIFDAPPDGRSVRLLKWLEKWSIARSDLTITVNEACKKIFSARSCGPEKIAVVMNTPDEEIFQFRTPKPFADISRGNDKKFVVLYHGTLVERNGLDLAVDAVGRVRGAVPNVELHIFGLSTWFLEKIMAEVKEKGLQEIVRYMGRVPLETIVTEIENCDLGVVPNHRNIFSEINTPVRIFEYIALGKPVIVPATRGIQDYFSQDSLLYFDAGDPDDLARQIEYAYSHPREVQETVRRAQEVYLEHTWDHEREVLLSRMSELLVAK
jgi:glycosyltransferase involved in cell wall biosynthesis